ncbi:uncharacterized protein [Asterias amurensis]|uniref:uncharacterized protein n=1 Tax=Asterias amurensis TaxID=7602 RepID=UPI003AB80495
MVNSCNMCVFLLVCLLYLVAAAQGQVGKDCKRHKFSECGCHQYGVRVHRDDKSEYEEGGMVVYTRTDLAPDSKNPYYFCLTCMDCGDGILVEHKCTQKSDTVCSKDQCTDETWTYNFNLKACQPPQTTTPPPTVRSKVVTQKDTMSVASEPIRRSKVTDDKPDGQMNTIIMGGLAGGVAVLCGLVVFMAVLVCRIKRQHAGLLSGTPSSSNNSLRESVAPAHV